MLKRAAPRFSAALQFSVILLTFLIANRLTWLCVFEVNKPLFSCSYGTRTDELLLYVIDLGLVLWIVQRSGELSRYQALWRRNWVLISFLVFCFLSAVWSVDPVLTVYRSLLVAISAMVAAYFGMRYREADWFRMTVVFAMVVTVLSYLLVLLLPGAAIMTTFALEGDWRGAFSHKNYLGAIAAYGQAILLYLVLTFRRDRSRPWLLAILFLLIGLIIFSKSATGLILFALLDGLVLILVAVDRWGTRLQRRHYVWLGSVAVGIGLLTVINLDVLFGLIGRSPSLTGRVPLWAYLFDRLAEHNLWLGFGLGTIWARPEFRIQAAADLEWPFQVINGHNGFVDVLMYLGIVGLLIFVSLAIQATARVIRRVASEGIPSAMWRIITLAYVLTVNVTISFFFEFETFHWFLFLVVLFMSTSIPAAGSPRKSNDQGWLRP